MYLPRRHHCLSDTLREYLEKEREKADSKTKASNDYHIREILKASLNDLTFLMQKIDDKQFDKISSELTDSLDDLLSSFCQRLVNLAVLKYAAGRIKAYNIRVGFKRWLSANESMFLIGSLFQNAVDSAFGDKKFNVIILSNAAYQEYEIWLAERHRDKA
jgi:hypothetical protein